MIPQIGASTDITLVQNQAVSLVPDGAANATAAETTRAVEPPKQVFDPPLIPPNPEAPAGPPPAFEATLLDQARDAFPGTEDPYEVPPSAGEKIVTSLQRMETPYDTATVDVSR